MGVNSHHTLHQTIFNSLRSLRITSLQKAMAYSKTLLLVGLLFAAVLILSSEVSARDLAEAAAQTQGGVVEDNQWGHAQLDHHHHHHHHHHHGHHGHHGHGKQGHGDEAMENESEGGKK